MRSHFYASKLRNFPCLVKILSYTTISNTDCRWQWKPCLKEEVSSSVPVCLTHKGVKEYLQHHKSKTRWSNYKIDTTSPEGYLRKRLMHRCLRSQRLVISVRVSVITWREGDEFSMNFHRRPPSLGNVHLWLIGQRISHVYVVYLEEVCSPSGPVLYRYIRKPGMNVGQLRHR